MDCLEAHIRPCRSQLTALDMPFLLLPFRPGTDPVGSKSFIRTFFKSRYEGTWQDNIGFAVRNELMLMEPIVNFLGLVFADTTDKLYRFCAA
jgi:hypothetical protein